MLLVETAAYLMVIFAVVALLAVVTGAIGRDALPAWAGPFLPRYWLALLTVMLAAFLALFFLLWSDLGPVRRYRQEVSAQLSLSSLARAQEQYARDHAPFSYALNIDQLSVLRDSSRQPLIAPQLTSGEHLGYRFEMQSGAALEHRGFPAITTWSAAAWPVEYGVSGRRSFLIDETGIIRAGDIGGVKGDHRLARP